MDALNTAPVIFLAFSLFLLLSSGGFADECLAYVFLIWNIICCCNWIEQPPWLALTRVSDGLSWDDVDSWVPRILISIWNLTPGKMDEKILLLLLLLLSLHTRLWFLLLSIMVLLLRQIASYWFGLRSSTAALQGKFQRELHVNLIEDSGIQGLWRYSPPLLAIWFIPILHW